MQGIRSKLTYANVMATIAVLGVFGIGTASAARHFINGAKIKPHTITGRQIKSKSLSAALFRGDLPHGPKGNTGATGAAGSTGPAGADASSILTGRLETLTPFGTCGSGVCGHRFAYPQGETAGTGFTTEAEATELSPATTVVARGLSVAEDHVPTSGLPPRNYVLRVNGQDTALRCTTTASSVNPTGTIKCSDTTDAVTIPPGSTVCLEVQQNYYTGGGVSDTVPVRFGWVAATH